MTGCSTNNSCDVTAGAIGTSSNPHILKTGVKWQIFSTIIKSDGAPFDLTGWTGSGQIRKRVEDLGTPIATLTVVATATTGRVEISLGATLSVNFAPGNYVFDAEFVNNADPDNVIPATPGTQFMCVVVGVTK